MSEIVMIVSVGTIGMFLPFSKSEKKLLGVCLAAVLVAGIFLLKN